LNWWRREAALGLQHGYALPAFRRKRSFGKRVQRRMQANR
jgi:hypothetical protein